ncbi:MAG: 3-oxoacyl-[acyl-carrier-protein] synthase III C-terminal domain-containing protein [archaeon]
MKFDRHIKIVGTGRYIPKRKIEADELDRILDVPNGTCLQSTGVSTRYWVEDETSSEMAELASRQALERAGLHPEDLDVIVSTNGVNQQPIPTGGCLLSEQLGLQKTHIPCFDINSSCMSFLQGLDTISYMLEHGRYTTALVCSSDITSVGINRKDIKSAPLFGDGAAALVLRKDETGSSGIYLSHIETFSRGAHLSEIRGGGNKLTAMEYSNETHDNFVYELHGTAMGRVVFEECKGFFARALKDHHIALKEIVEEVKAIIPHQVSPSFIDLLKRRMNFPNDKLLDLTRTFGNMLSVSIPLGIDEAISTHRVQRGDSMLLSGGGSGISLGMMYLRY